MDEPPIEVVAVDTRHWGEEGGCYSPDRRYRWSYSRRIGPGPTIAWIGLNPGTGDQEGRYRPTLQRMVDRSIAEGMGRVTLVNLFAWRATKPSDLRMAIRAREDVVGEACDEAIRAAMASADLTVVAWGAHGSLLGRDRCVAQLLKEPLWSWEDVKRTASPSALRFSGGSARPTATTRLNSPLARP